MEPPPFSSPKTRVRTRAGGSMDDPFEVIEIMGADFKSSSSSSSSNSKKNKRSKVVPYEVIDIDGDEDHSRVLSISKKANTDNKGKAPLMGYDKNQANLVKEVLAQDHTVTSSATEFGSMNGGPMNPFKSSTLLINNFSNFSDGFFDNGLLHNGLDNLSYYNDNMSYKDDALSLGSQFNDADLPSLVETSNPWFDHRVSIYNNPSQSNSSLLSTQLSFSLSNGADEVEVLMEKPIKSRQKPTATNSAGIPFQSSSRREKEEEDEVLKKLKLFKQFDTVHDHSDHHFSRSESSSKQPPKNWAKTIQQEWKLLEKDLPDTIFVRVYEERMDILRAVIVGAAGTPYHDGLFFFDISFPASYPSVPPKVYYHSGGLRLNPNLYNCGKVCLSLLNTWQGSKNEKWIPRKSTLLQVLLSIQALVLNAKPFFNEPGYAAMAGGKDGERMSQDYNENTFILSCRTMLFTLRKPPKHFEALVMGHFRERAHAILVACKAYMDGALVGCLVGGGVQDLEEGDASGSHKFKMQVHEIVKNLVPAFKQNGSKDCEHFLKFVPQTNNIGSGPGGGKQPTSYFNGFANQIPMAMPMPPMPMSLPGPAGYWFQQFWPK